MTEIKIELDQDAWNPTRNSPEAIYVGPACKGGVKLNMRRAVVLAVAPGLQKVMLSFKELTDDVLLAEMGEIRLKLTGYLSELLANHGWSEAWTRKLEEVVSGSFKDSGKRDDFMEVPSASYLEHLLLSLSSEIGYRTTDEQGDGLEPASIWDKCILAKASLDIRIMRVAGSDKSLLS